MMIKAAKIENGVVRDLWMVPSLDAFEGITLVSAPDGVGINFLYDGSTFTAPEPTAEDTAQKALEVTTTRNFKLLESDWTQLPDVPQDTKSNWATYRQALRDITLQAGFPWEVTWPDAP